MDRTLALEEEIAKIRREARKSAESARQASTGKASLSDLEVREGAASLPLLFLVERFFVLLGRPRL